MTTEGEEMKGQALATALEMLPLKKPVFVLLVSTIHGPF